MLRLKYLIQFAHTDNVTWDYLPIGYWSAVESHVGVMVACLPAIRSLQRSIRDKLFPKPVTATSYYEDDTKQSSKKASRKDSHSRIFSSLGRSQVDKEDFVRLDEYEMRAGLDAKDGVSSPTPSSFERTLTQSFKSHEDVLPLAHSGAPMGQPMGQPMGGILVQSEYSVDRASPLGHILKKSDSEELTDKLRCRI
jgi:hypothetical protein